MYVGMSMKLHREEDDVVVLDGGMGHELKLRGIDDGSFVSGLLANENLLQASTVESIHYDYLAAGCDVITTNSFVAVPRRMLECGLASNDSDAFHRAAMLIKSSVDRAMAAVSNFEDSNGKGTRQKKRIAGCVPPLTECYFGDKVPLSVETMVPEYELIISTLLESDVDILLCETLSTVREGLGIMKALSKIRDSPQIPIWLNFTIKDDEPSKLRGGESLENACSKLITVAASLKLPLEAIGINCSAPYAISKALTHISHLAEKSDIKLCAYGNCFQTTTSEWMESLKDDSSQSKVNNKSEIISSKDYDHNGYLLPCAYARYASQWTELGAKIIGGCCGCRPEHMKQAVSMLRSNNKNQ
ncbi:hypothetical protein ACHAWC_003421 [Mediolabrus comicus]